MRGLKLIAAALIVLVAGAGYSAFYFHQQLKMMDRKMSDLTKQVAEATQTARNEAAAASSASQQAGEAAARAEIAAGQRASAEQQRDQAQTAQTQAESAARQATEQASAAQSELDALRKQRQEELNHMQEALSRVVETRRTPNGMVMVLSNSTFKFDFDSADLKPHNRELLSRIAGILLASKGFGLSVYGYTDDVGTQQYNQKLSERRAEAVRNYLVQAGLDASLVNAKGFGKTSPLVNGGTEEARAINRRVEIAVTDSEITYPGITTQ